MKSNRFQTPLLLLLSVIALVVWYPSLVQSNSGVLAVSFLDVGQGDAIFIQTPSGKQILIDAGQGKQVLRELSTVMPLYDRTIDVVVATHPDLDHIGGLPDVFERYEVDLFLKPGIEHDSEAVVALAETLSVKNVPVVLARKDMVLKLDENIDLRILFPDRDVELIESNAGSIVMQLDYLDTEFLLTGDAPKSIENYLVSIYGDELESEVLKVGHHGSKTSTSEYFLNVVSADYGVISAGDDNRYGHPHAEVTDRLDSFDIETYSTAEAGTITFHSDGTTVYKK